MERVATSSVRALLTLARQAAELPADRREAMAPDVTVFLRRAWDSAGESGRARYSAWVQTSKAKSAWEAVTGKPGAPPPVLMLLRMPVASASATDGDVIRSDAAWAPLRTALDTWDTKTIERWLATDGWRPPGRARVPFATLDDLATAPSAGPKKPPEPAGLRPEVIVGGLAGAAALGGLAVWLVSRNRNSNHPKALPAEAP